MLNIFASHLYDFNPLSPCGERPVCVPPFSRGRSFQPTLPMRGETDIPDVSFSAICISTHSPHAGRDASSAENHLPSSISTHSPHAGRDQSCNVGDDGVSQFQPTLPMRGETMFLTKNPGRYMISTHSPHAGRDQGTLFGKTRSGNFNPLSPCGERQQIQFLIDKYNNFNPLSPCGERHCRRGWKKEGCDFNPLSPCGERPKSAKKMIRYFDFNPLSPCGERQGCTGIISCTTGFQPTLPMRGETSMGS